MPNEQLNTKVNIEVDEISLETEASNWTTI